MKRLMKNCLIAFGLTACFPAFAQNAWIGQLSLSDFDCENKTACYTLGVKGIEYESWALGDQNYRFFFDAGNLSITSVTSLLSTALYSEVQIQEVLELVGQNQEDFSPLDNIDDHLGFIDFNIIAQAKQLPHLAKQISNEAFTNIAEICLEVSPELMENVGEEYAVNLLFSRPLTAGQITNQFSVISEIDAPNHTRATNDIGFLDVNYNVGLEAQLGEICQLLNSDKEIDLTNNRLTLFPNPYAHGEMLTYHADIITEVAHSATVYDATGQVVEAFGNLPAGNKKLKFQNQLPAGVYIFHLKSDTHQFMEELIITNK